MMVDGRDLRLAGDERQQPDQRAGEQQAGQRGGGRRPARAPRHGERREHHGIRAAGELVKVRAVLAVGKIRRERDRADERDDRAPRERFAPRRPAARGQPRADADGKKRHRFQHLRRMPDARREPVARLPPAVENERRGKRQRAPQRQPRARRRLHAAEPHTRGGPRRGRKKQRQRGTRGERHGEVVRDVRRRPDEVDADGGFPRIIPQQTQRHTRRAQRQQPPRDRRPVGGGRCGRGIHAVGFPTRPGPRRASPVALC